MRARAHTNTHTHQHARIEKETEKGDAKKYAIINVFTYITYTAT